MIAPDPGHAVRRAARDDWSDPPEAALRAVHGLLEYTAGAWSSDGLAAVQALRSGRADSPLMLAVTEAALHTDAVVARRALKAVERLISDRAWTADLGLRAAGFATLGVLSFGDHTVAVLEAMVELTDHVPEVYTHQRSVARGLGHLGLPVFIHPPAQAEALLLPVAARHGDRVWVTGPAARYLAEAVRGGRTVLPIVPPAAELSPLNRLEYRPASILIDATL